MGTGEWEVLVDGLGRLEAPCLDLAGNLCFSDMEGEGAIYRLTDGGRLDTVLRGRSHVGGLVPHAGGGLVATGATVVVIENGTPRTVMSPDGGWGFNDIATNSSGHVLVGMHGERPTAAPPEVEASLWFTDGRHAPIRCYGGVQLTNGIGVSPDGRHVYHNDTLRRVVWVSDVDGEGVPGDPRVLHELRHGMPDGMAMDEAGGIWLAMIGAGKIVRITPDGDEDLVVETPMPYASALCFGGTDRRDLYVTTFGGAPYDPDHTGSVIVTRVSVAGARVTPANV